MEGYQRYSCWNFDYDFKDFIRSSNKRNFCYLMSRDNHCQLRNIVPKICKILGFQCFFYDNNDDNNNDESSIHVSMIKCPKCNLFYTENDLGYIDFVITERKLLCPKCSEYFILDGSIVYSSIKLKNTIFISKKYTDIPKNLRSSILDLNNIKINDILRKQIEQHFEKEIEHLKYENVMKELLFLPGIGIEYQKSKEHFDSMLLSL